MLSALIRGRIPGAIDLDRRVNRSGLGVVPSPSRAGEVGETRSPERPRRRGSVSALRRKRASGRERARCQSRSQASSTNSDPARPAPDGSLQRGPRKRSASSTPARSESVASPLDMPMPRHISVASCSRPPKRKAPALRHSARARKVRVALQTMSLAGSARPSPTGEAVPISRRARAASPRGDCPAPAKRATRRETQQSRCAEAAAPATRQLFDRNAKQHEG